MAKLEFAFLHLTIICLLPFSCAAKDTCSEVQCRVLTVGENLASEFQDKASEEGVRIIYFNLQIGNDSYHPLELKDELFPERWVWAETISEPMLSLPCDYDILSLGLLNYQVRSMAIPLEDHPSGCLASLNSSCQNLVVARAPLDNVTRGRSEGRKTEVVCVQMIEKYADKPSLVQLKYHCCSPDTTTIRCGLPVVSTEWFDAFETILTLFSVVMFLYCPAFLLALPDWFFNLRNELDKEDYNWRLSRSGDQDDSIANHTRNGYEAIGENEQGPEDGHERTKLIPVDDASPITCSTLLVAYVHQLPKLRLSFTMKLAIFLFCIAPSILYVKLGVYLTLKHEYLDRVPPETLTIALTLTEPEQSIKTPGGRYFFSLWAFIAFVFVLFLRPKDLFLQKNSHDRMCEFYSSFAAFTRVSITLPEAALHGSTMNVGDFMFFYLKVLQPAFSSFLVSCFLSVHNKGLKKMHLLATCSLPLNRNHNMSRTRLALGILWMVFLILPALLLGLSLGAMCLLLLFVALIFSLLCFSPVMSLVIVVAVKFANILANQSNKCVRYCLWMLFNILQLLIVTFLFLAPSLSTRFIVRIFGFTIMGLVLNAQIVTPYVAFLVVVATNIDLCYANLQSKYKEIKGFILQFWQQESQTEHSNRDTIPSKLFWFVSDRAFPVRIEICVMFGKMAAILTFLFLAVSSIIFFGNTYNISTVVSTIAVFVSGVIPGLFFKGLTKGENFSGWRKIKLKREIETAVKDFDRERGSTSINNESEEERPLIIISHPTDQVFETSEV